MTKVTIISDPASGVTAAKVHHWGVTGVGISEQTLPDVFNITIGEELALGRAFQDLGRKLEKRGYKKVHQIERARIKKEKKAAKATSRKGELITTVEQYEALPIGTKVVLSANDKGTLWGAGYIAIKKSLNGNIGFYTEDDIFGWDAHMVTSGSYGDFTIVSIP